LSSGGNAGGGMLAQFTLTTDAASVDALSDALLASGALAVAVDDADVDTAAETPRFGEPGNEGAPIEPVGWRRNRLEVLCAEGIDPELLLATACANAGIAPRQIESKIGVADADWVRLTQSQFPPTRVAEGVWVVPSWHEPPEPQAVNIRIDPGAAFGTGTHPTTRLCLSWLAAELPRGARVLDYGCGSGILSIAAALLGATESVGTDIDPRAIEVALQNARRNAVTCARYTLPDGLPRAVPQERFDVVIANILAAPLIVLAPALLSRLADDGVLVLSGILEQQGDSVCAAYARLASPPLKMARWAGCDGWVCLVGRRGEPAASSAAPST
jgi:ribosomal protein L11 methyltransferase